MSLNELYVLCAISAVVTAVNIRLDIQGIVTIGKSGNAWEKIKNLYTIRQRLELKHIKEHSNFFLKKLHILFIARKVNFLLIGILLCLLILSRIDSKWIVLVQYILIAKVVVLDIPALINYLFSTEADKKNGGVIPKYERWLTEKGITFKNKNR